VQLLQQLRARVDAPRLGRQRAEQAGLDGREVETAAMPGQPGRADCASGGCRTQPEPGRPELPPGCIHQLELLDAQRQLAAAQQGLVTLRQTEQANGVVLLRALGGRWQAGG